MVVVVEMLGNWEFVVELVIGKSQKRSSSWWWRWKCWVIGQWAKKGDPSVCADSTQDSLSISAFTPPDGTK